MTSFELVSTRCAICNIPNNAIELYPANFALDAFNPDVFSARRLPDMLHYRLVKCRNCGLVRSDPMADSNLIVKLYELSSFRYGQDVTNLQHTYGMFLKKLEKYNHEKSRLLEIGCGNGFFLEEALLQGYQEIKGVEPSEDAIRSAKPEIRPHITCSIMQANLYQEGYFNVICMFQVFDHISEPNTFLQNCINVLKPGGFILGFNHNVEALTAKLMGEKSPIVDIEHTFLYSPRTMRKLFEKHGLKVIEAGSAINRISLRSLARLMPIPKATKEAILSIFGNSWIGKISLSVPLGNLYIIAQKEIAK